MCSAETYWYAGECAHGVEAGWGREGGGLTDLFSIFCSGAWAVSAQAQGSVKNPFNSVKFSVEWMCFNTMCDQMVCNETKQLSWRELVPKTKLGTKLKRSEHHTHIVRLPCRYAGWGREGGGLRDLFNIFFVQAYGQ